MPKICSLKNVNPEFKIYEEILCFKVEIQQKD